MKSLRANCDPKSDRATEEDRTRQAYLEQPDSEAEAEDWSSAEKWLRGAPPFARLTD
jgi:hypothetical protein